MVDFAGHLVKESILTKLMLLLSQINALVLAISQKLSVSNQFWKCHISSFAAIGTCPACVQVEQASHESHPIKPQVLPFQKMSLVWT